MNKKFLELLRVDALTFIQQTHLELHQSPLGNDPYIRLLAFDLERIASGVFNRYICNIAPGTGKTSLFGVALPAWILAHEPSARILIISYGEELATDTCRKVRTVVGADWYARHSRGRNSRQIIDQRGTSARRPAGKCMRGQSMAEPRVFGVTT